MSINRYLEKVDHQKELEYEAKDFTWMHRCTNEYCNWLIITHEEVQICAECNQRTLYKYPMLHKTKFTVSRWWTETPCEDS